MTTEEFNTQMSEYDISNMEWFIDTKDGAIPVNNVEIKALITGIDNLNAPIVKHIIMINTSIENELVVNE